LSLKSAFQNCTSMPPWDLLIDSDPSLASPCTPSPTQASLCVCANGVRLWGDANSEAVSGDIWPDTLNEKEFISLSDIRPAAAAVAPKTLSTGMALSIHPSGSSTAGEPPLLIFLLPTLTMGGTCSARLISFTHSVILSSRSWAIMLVNKAKIPTPHTQVSILLATKHICW